MLQFIREKSQGWIAGTIIGVICLVFALWGVRSYLYSSQTGNTIAKVNGTKISQEQYSTVYNQLRRQQQIQAGSNYSPTPKNIALMKKMALQSIISNIVLNQAAYSAGFRIAPELAEITLSKMPIFQVNGAFSEARFQEILRGMLYTPEQFFEEIRQNMLVTQVKSGIMESNFSLPNEVKQAAQLIKQRRTFKYTILPLRYFMPKVKLTKSDIQNYYKTNADQFKTQEKVSIEYILLSMTDLMNKIRPTALQLKAFYQNNISSYTQPKRWRLATILVSVPMKATSKKKKVAKQKVDMIANKVKSSANFASLAKQYSDDTATASSGGVLPWVNGAQLGNEVNNALRQLKNIGDVSMPIRTTRGYEIVKVLGIKPEKVIPFSAVSNKVKQMYRQQKAQQQYADMSDQLANLTYESPNSLNAAAKQLHLTIKSTPMFTKEGGKQGIIKNPKVLSVAFGDDVVNQHDNSEPVNLSDTDVLVLRAKQYHPAKLKPLNEVKSIIVKTLTQQAAQKQAMAMGKKILTQLNNGVTLQKITSNYPVKWRQAANISRQSKSINPAVALLAFQSFVPVKLGQIVYTGDSLASGDFAIIALSSVRPGSALMSPAQQKVFNESTAKGLGLVDYNLYVNGLMKKAKIKHYKAGQ